MKQNNKEKILQEKKYKNVKGAALIYTIIVFVIAMAITTTMINFASNNINQTSYQERRMQSYLAAMAGYELAYSALVAEKPGNLSSLLEAYRFIPSTRDISDNIVVKSSIDNTEFDVEISIKKVPGTSEWVEIRSKATVKGSALGDVQNIAVVRVNTSLPDVKKFELQIP